jgi:L-histidine Nalpha-methyltransferase
MTGKVLHIPQDHDIMTLHDQLEEFKKDISVGLTKTPKQIPSKYFYDERGSELFNAITRHPDYYLTECELEILNTHKNAIAELVNSDAINLIELGPGEGVKSQLLIKQFLQQTTNFTYSPIDISENYLIKLVNQFNLQLPELKTTAIHADYFKGLEWLSTDSKRKNLVLFLGSSIGNFDNDAAHGFLRHLWQSLHDGDNILIGFDLKKDINTLLRAYNDSDGITREFNLNLLQRMNRELGANFNRDAFSHYATYNVNSGAMESYLISLKEQAIDVSVLRRAFVFMPFEPIHVEVSYKYLLPQIERFATDSGFEVMQNYFDSKCNFVDSLWRVYKS